MIIILSIPDDFSTTNVIEWIWSQSGKFIRFDDAQLIKQQFVILLKDETFSIKYTDCEFENSGRNVFWFRRSSLDGVFSEFNLLNDPELEKQTKRYLLSESNQTIELIYRIFKDDYWLSNPQYINLDKSYTLKIASTLNLRIPVTCITNNLKSAIEFKQKHNQVIIKSIHELIFLRGYATYTSIVTDEFLNQLPDNFIPCLFQEAIDKEYEIRTFFLEGKFYSMAIFSQLDEQTSVDFRRYNDVIPNRVVPYKLPNDIETKLSKLMSLLNLNTGSIDLIKSKNGEIVFLEVNPVGQFGMVSFPCNYYLEKEIAETLIKMEINAN